MGTGALGHLAISRQNSFGTATGSWFFAPFVSESLVHAIDLIAKEGIRASLVEPGVLQGLDRAEVNLRGDAEEFDIVAPNESDDPILSKEGSFLLVECKNWSRPVDPVALDHFRAKLRDRFRRVQLGILIGVAGFTEGVRNKVASMNNEPQLILLVDGNDLNVWITAADPLAWLKERLRAAVLRGQG